MTLTSPTRVCRSVGIVRSRTQATEFVVLSLDGRSAYRKSAANRGKWHCKTFRATDRAADLGSLSGGEVKLTWEWIFQSLSGALIKWAVHVAWQSWLQFLDDPDNDLILTKLPLGNRLCLCEFDWTELIGIESRLPGDVSELFGLTTAVNRPHSSCWIRLNTVHKSISLKQRFPPAGSTQTN
jgi:hypothetical protein